MILKYKVLLILLIAFLCISCSQNSTCENQKEMEGIYGFDLSYTRFCNTSDTVFDEKLLLKIWGDVKVILKNNEYYFNTKDDFYRAYEGNWKLEKIGLDDECYLFIVQNGRRKSLPYTSFSIKFSYSSQEYVVCFKKE